MVQGDCRAACRGTVPAIGAGSCAVIPASREFAPAAAVLDTDNDTDNDTATAPNASMHFDGLGYDLRAPSRDERAPKAI